MSAVALILSACSEHDDSVEEYPNWQEVNDKAFSDTLAYARQQIAAGDTATWKVFCKWSLNDSTGWADNQYVVVKVLKKGTGTVSPLFSDSVRINYVGQLLPSTSYASGYIFSDYNASSYAPVDMLLSDNIDGMATALMHMHVGDEWEIFIPYNLAYGTTAMSTIPAYSMLRFYVTLRAFYRAGVDVPDYKAKRGWITADNED